MNSTYIQKLLIRIGQEDKKAFDDFFDYYYPRLLKFAVNYVKSYQNAEEVVSDVLIKLLNRKGTLKDIDNFNGYIFEAVKNQSLTFLSKKKPTVHIDEDEADFIIIDYSTPETAYLNAELQRLFANTIENLPTKRKLIYKLIKEDKLKYKEVAELLDISKKTVEVHMGLAVNNLRETINNYLSNMDSSSKLKKLMSVVSPLIVGSFLLHILQYFF